MKIDIDKSHDIPYIRFSTKHVKGTIYTDTSGEIEYKFYNSPSSFCLNDGTFKSNLIRLKRIHSDLGNAIKELDRVDRKLPTYLDKIKSMNKKYEADLSYSQQCDLFIKLFKSKRIMWKLNHSLVIWLRKFRKIQKKHSKNPQGALKDAIDWVKSSPEKANYAKSDIKGSAQRHAECMLNGSVRRLYKEAFTWCKGDSLTNQLDLDMIGLHISDCADHLEIACMMYENKLTRASTSAHQLDSASRDYICNSVWNYLLKY